MKMTLAAVIALLAGCASTRTSEPRPGPRRALLSDARFLGAGGFGDRLASLRSVDGVLVGDADRGYPRLVDLSSGTHAVAVRILDSDERPSGYSNAAPPEYFRSLTFMARPGERYALKIDPSADDPRTAAVWIEDGAGELAGGNRPERSGTAEFTLDPSSCRTLLDREPIRILSKSGRVVLGRFKSCDRTYLWLTLPNGRRRALTLSEIAKLSPRR